MPSVQINLVSTSSFTPWIPVFGKYSMVADVQTRLETRQKLADLETDAYPEIPVNKPTSGDILERVTEYFEADPVQIANK